MDPAGFFPHLIIILIIAVVMVSLTIVAFKIGFRRDDFSKPILHSDGRRDWEAGYQKKPWYTSSEGQLMGVITGIYLLFFSVLAFLPFNTTYHQFYHVTGTVTHVTNTITDSSGELTSSPVVTLDTLDRDVTFDNPRAVNLLDKEVTLTCTIQWVPYAQDRINCDIYEVH